MIRFGVIGYGYWGPNIVRNLKSLDGVKVVTVCDQRPESLHKAKQTYPDIHVTEDCSEVLCSTDIDAVAVITPVWTHFDLAERALRNGKHVFVEKPFTSNSHQAEQLIELAERNDLVIMVDHTFLFTGAVKKIRQLVDDDELGRLYYYDSRESIWGFFSTTSMSFGIWRLMICQLSITSSARGLRQWLRLARSI